MGDSKRVGAVEVSAVSDASAEAFADGAAGPRATLRSLSVTCSPRAAAAQAARPRSPADG